MYTLEELRKMKPEQLQRALEEAKMNLAKFKFESRTGQTKDHHKIKEARIQTAQISTILNNRAKDASTAK